MLRLGMVAWAAWLPASLTPWPRSTCRPGELVFCESLVLAPPIIV